MIPIAFIVPATTNQREWTDVMETDLYMFLCQSLEINPPQGVQITLLIGYDYNDKIYSVFENRQKFNALFTKFKNSLGDIAINQGFEWIKALGSDIVTPKDLGWVCKMINDLKKSHRIGISAGDSGNPELPMTQFLIHKTHIQTFGFIFPKEIENWGCDNWIQEVYPKKFVHYSPELKLLNVGGSPRYEIKFSRKFIDALVKRHRPTISRRINKSMNY